MSRILVVDDNLDLAANMRTYLDAKGHNVVVCHCAAEAYAVLGSQDFDLLILDWDLPDAVGPEICKGYRDRGGLGQVLMLTGRTSKDDTVAGLTAGADDYLVKPVNISEFGARVDAQLRRASMTKRPEPVQYDESLVGKTFAGCYDVEAVLGKGAMGIVFKGNHKTIKRTAAIKILTGRNQGVADRKRFEREAQAMSMLNHHNLIKIYDFGLAEQDTPFIIMEYLEGSSLNLVLQTYGSIPVRDALPLFIDVCEGLEHAHSQSIIHRDLKPANIMISEDGNHATILDLGVVKFMDEDNSDMNLTFAGEIFGSPFYMSPEQAINKPLDARSDVYSLGCVLYETLTGEVPFIGYSFVEVTNAKLSGKAPSICEKFPHAQFPVSLDKTIKKALSLKPDKRQATVTEFKHELKEVLASVEKDDSGSKNPKILTFVRSLLEKKS